jgi:dehydrogenase/reductase SDR family protein 12
MMKPPIVADAIDAAIELAVVPSFSRVGPAVRRRLFRWEAPGEDALTGRTAVVTGPTSGIGRAAARGLAVAGARVVLVGRDSDRLEQVRSELISSTGADRYRAVVADMSSLASVREAADEIARSEARVDVLIDNAGAIYPNRETSADGIEKTLAILVCGPFALTAALLPRLRESRGRVISVTSGGMYTQRVRFDDIQFNRRAYNGTLAYAQAKRIQVALVREWARRNPDAGVAFNAMHPGWADTPGLAESLPRFSRLMRPLLRSVDEGADTIVWLATTAEVTPPGGRLYLDRRVRPFDRIPQTRLTLAERIRLWDMISALTDK